MPVFKKTFSTLGVSWRMINTIIIVVAFFAPWLSSCGNANGFEVAWFGIIEGTAFSSFESILIDNRIMGFFHLSARLGAICLGLYLITGFLGYRSSHIRLSAIGLLFPATGGIVFIAISFLLHTGKTEYWGYWAETLLWGYWLALAGVISSIALEFVESGWIVMETGNFLHLRFPVKVMGARIFQWPSFRYHFLLKTFTFICAALLMASMALIVIWGMNFVDSNQSGHAADVNSIAFAPDGKILASGSDDGTIKLWEVATGNELRTIHSVPVHSLAFAPDGKRLVSASGYPEYAVKLWDVATGKELRTLINLCSGCLVNSVVFTPDGKTLASGAYYDGTVKVWDVATGKELRTFINLCSGCSMNSVVFAPDGKTLASGSNDGVIELWDVATGKELRTISLRSSWVNSIAFTPDGKTLAFGSSDRTIKLWDVATGKELRTLSGHSKLVSSVAFAPDGKTLATGSEDRTIKLWDVATGKELRAFRGRICIFIDDRGGLTNNCNLWLSHYGLAE